MGDLNELRFGKELINLVEPCVAPLHWQKAGSSEWGSGSAFFVNTGTALFGITAKHVYDEIAKQVELDRAIVCLLYNFPLTDVRSRLISRGRDCDVATFEILRSEISRLDRRSVPWPPSIPPKGKAVVFGGFPSLGRRLSASGSVVTFGILKASTHVDSLSERDISLVRPPDDEVTDVDGKGLLPRGLDLGGMSGGPVLAVLDGVGIVSWALAGVIYECGTEFEIIKAARADMIGADGVING
jgi:hypothetical protein